MITGIIMAAGFSKRMGEDKLLMEEYSRGVYQGD